MVQLQVAEERLQHLVVQLLVVQKKESQLLKVEKHHKTVTRLLNNLVPLLKAEVQNLKVNDHRENHLR